MSRFTKKLTCGYCINYGYDRSFGFFADILTDKKEPDDYPNIQVGYMSSGKPISCIDEFERLLNLAITSFNKELADDLTPISLDVGPILDQLARDPETLLWG